MLLFDLAPPTLQNSGIFFTIHPSSLPLWRFAAEIAAIRRLYIGLRVRYKYYKKHSRNWFGLEPPSRRSRSESAHKCIPYIGRDLAVPGPKTCFWVKTENGQALACPSKRAISDRVVSRSMQNDPYARCYREVSQRQRWNSEDRYVTDPTGGIDHARSAELTPVVRYRPSYEHRACRQQSAHSATELPFLPAIEVTPRGTGDAARRGWYAQQIDRDNSKYVPICALLRSVVRISNTRSSADADNGLDAFVGQSRSTNISGPFQVK